MEKLNGWVGKFENWPDFVLEVGWLGKSKSAVLKDWFIVFPNVTVISAIINFLVMF